MGRKQIGGGLLIVAGGFFARETLIWIWNKALDLLSKNFGEQLSWSTFPWVNALACVAMLVGIWMILPRRRQVRVAMPIGRILASNASSLASRISSFRSSSTLGRESVLDLITDINAARVTFEKAGYAVPKLPIDMEVVRQLHVWQIYFANIAPMLNNGHTAEAKNMASEIAAQADTIAGQYQPPSLF